MGQSVKQSYKDESLSSFHVPRSNAFNFEFIERKKQLAIANSFLPVELEGRSARCE
jgi:hypothetical protein